jgi:hypothetical protein
MNNRPRKYQHVDPARVSFELIAYRQGHQP